jgi:selenocysteine lyase/cysteine desulfurase
MRHEARAEIARIDDRTRVVAVSTICWVTGALTDVAAIAAECRARGIVLVVDAIQTCGVVPLDVRALGASWVAVGGLKWMCATPGSGFLWVEPRVAARAHPTRFGILAGTPSSHPGWQEWLSSGTGSIEDDVLFAAQGRAFETGGTINYPGAIGLLTMARLFARIPSAEALAHVRGLAAQLMTGLEALGLPLVTPRDPARHANIVVFRLPAGHAAELAILPKLWERGIAVNARWLKSVGGVRACIHAMNAAEDIDRLLVALRELK